MREKIKQILILSVLVIFLIIPYFVFADAAVEGQAPQAATIKSVMGALGTNAGYSTETTDQNTVFDILGLVISIVLGLLGTVFLILMLYAGYNWFTAGGNEEKTTKAKSTIWRAIIGLIIVVSAYVLSDFVIRGLLQYD